MGYIFSIIFGACVGFLLCSILVKGKMSDLEDEAYRLRKENYKLKTTVK